MRNSTKLLSKKQLLGHYALVDLCQCTVFVSLASQTVSGKGVSVPIGGGGLGPFSRESVTLNLV